MTDFGATILAAGIFLGLVVLGAIVGSGLEEMAKAIKERKGEGK